MDQRNTAKPKNTDKNQSAGSSAVSQPVGVLHSPSLWLGSAAFVLCLLAYIATLAPTVTFEDSGAFIAAAKHLGVVHPPGYPLWCLLGHGFTWAPIGNVAQRVHMLSAVCAAGAVWACYLLGYQILQCHVAAFIGALTFGFSRIFWSQAVIAEVYTLNALLTMLALYFALCWWQTRQEKWLYCLCGAVGLGATNHHLIVLITPALLVWVVLRHWRVVLSRRVVGLGCLILLTSLSIYLYLPVRANSDTPINFMGQMAGSSLAEQMDAVIGHISRRGYKTAEEKIRQSGGLVDVVRHCATALRGCITSFSWPIALVGLAGAVALWCKHRSFLVVSCAIAILNIVVLNVILHAKYNDAWAFTHRVYYIPVHAVFAVWVSAGFAVLISSLQKRLKRWGTISIGVAAGVLIGILIVSSLRHVNRRGDDLARQFGLAFLRSVPQGAGIMPVAEEVIFPCLYLKYVEGIRPDVEFLSPHFGWDGSPVGALVSPTPMSENLRRVLPGQDWDWISVPHGLGHLLTRDADVDRAHENFVTVSPPPPDPGPLLGDGVANPFLIAVRSSISAYHARAAAKYAAQGQMDIAAPEFAQAERLACDAYSYFLLATIYQDLDLHRQRSTALLEQALDWYDEHFDPSIMRYYPIRRQDIVAKIDVE